MAGKRFAPIGTAGQTVKALDWNASNQVWNTSTLAYQTYSSASFANYINALTERGSTGNYCGDVAAAALSGWARSTFHIGATESILVGFQENLETDDPVNYFGTVGQTGLTMKALDWNEAGEVWNGSAYVTYSAASWASYGTAVTEIGTTGIYGGTRPSSARTDWVRSTFHVSAAEGVSYALQLNPDTSDDPVSVGTLAGVWRCAPASEPEDPPRLYKKSGDSRRFAFDLGDLEEIIAGQTIVSASIVGTGVTVGTPAIGSYRVAATFSAGTLGDASVALLATLSGGSIITRVGTLVIS